MKYLTKEIKQYYMDDFNNNVVKCTDEYWGLDEGVLEVCTEINKNDNVQTLYSKKYSGGLGEPMSYLWVLYSKDADTNKIDKFVKECKSKLDSFIFEYCEAPEPIICDPEGVANLCLADPKYLQHGFINIMLMDSFNVKKHNLFWRIIAKHIKNW
jgi:hypothetical protein